WALEGFLRVMAPLASLKASREAQAPGIESLLIVNSSTNEVLEIITGVDAGLCSPIKSDRWICTAKRRQVCLNAVVHALLVALVRREGDTGLKTAEPRRHIGEVH